MNIILTKVTFKLLFIIGILDITKSIVLPKLSLLILIIALMAVDLVTGLLRAKFQKQPITSDKLRHTVIKFLQYFGSLGLIVVISNQNQKSEQIVLVLSLARDGVSLLIIYIECLSIFENLYIMDTKTPFALYVIRPIYWVLSLAIRNNTLKRAAEDQRDNSNGQEQISHRQNQPDEQDTSG